MEARSNRATAGAETNGSNMRVSVAILFSLDFKELNSDAPVHFRLGVPHRFLRRDVSDAG
ncbi:hypothetical protein BRAS3809_6590019 [Bradyrhizobium sp. STM 3809]|nr:hypothetical protein BRAS3809_6590019 [Bradyrhizobium sp. STM 3809]